MLITVETLSIDPEQVAAISKGTDELIFTLKSGIQFSVVPFTRNLINPTKLSRETRAKAVEQGRIFYTTLLNLKLEGVAPTFQKMLAEFSQYDAFKEFVAEVS